MTHEKKFQEILEFQGMYKNGFSALYLVEEQIDILIEYVWELREQAERVQELEEHHDRWLSGQNMAVNHYNDFKRLKEQNKLYRKVLEKIKDNSSCVVAFGYAVKALVESK